MLRYRTLNWMLTSNCGLCQAIKVDLFSRTTLCNHQPALFPQNETSCSPLPGDFFLLVWLLGRKSLLSFTCNYSLFHSNLIASLLCNLIWI
jgi:hypothetical protein